jgi:hypothetical protein
VDTYNHRNIQIQKTAKIESFTKSIACSTAEFFMLKLLVRSCYCSPNHLFLNR